MYCGIALHLSSKTLVTNRQDLKALPASAWPARTARRRTGFCARRAAPPPTGSPTEPYYRTADPCPLVSSGDQRPNVTCNYYRGSVSLSLGLLLLRQKQLGGLACQLYAPAYNQPRRPPYRESVRAGARGREAVQVQYLLNAAAACIAGQVHRAVSSSWTPGLPPLIRTDVAPLPQCRVGWRPSVPCVTTVTQITKRLYTQQGFICLFPHPYQHHDVVLTSNHKDALSLCLITSSRILVYYHMQKRKVGRFSLVHTLIN
jgi:hypothetical protein